MSDLCRRCGEPYSGDCAAGECVSIPVGLESADVSSFIRLAPEPDGPIPGDSAGDGVSPALVVKTDDLISFSNYGESGSLRVAPATQAQPPDEVSRDVITVRPMEPGDLNYVRSTWVRSRWSQVRRKQMRGDLPPEVIDAWFKSERSRIDAILAGDEVQILVACDPIKPESVLGWIAYGGHLAPFFRAIRPLYRYVRATFRGFGIEEMLEEAIRQ